MSSVYGLVADLHLHNWSSFSTELKDGQNSRLAGLLGEVERCAAEVHRAGGKKVVFAGDVFHVRGSVAPSVLNPTKDTLDSIHKKYGTEFVIIPGNHDLEGKDATRLGSAVTALECGHVRICNEVTFEDGLQANLFPWFEKTIELKAELERCAPKEGEVYDAIIHAPIDGVIAGLPLHGLEPEYLASLGYRRVFAGHYHNHKAFEGGAVSIGALAHHTWSDIGTKAGFLLIDSGKFDYRWMKSHLPEFIDLTKLACEADHADIPLMVDGHYVRVRVEASKSKDVEAARQELLEMGALAVLVQAEPKPPVSEARAGHTVKAGASLEVSVSEFIGAMPALSDTAAVTAAALSVLGSIATIS